MFKLGAFTRRRDFERLGASVLALLLMISPTSALAQGQSAGAVAPITERERMLLERIQKLEDRLATLEAKGSIALTAPAPKPEAAASAPAPANAATPADALASANAQQPPTDRPESPVNAAASAAKELEEPKMWGDWNPGPGYKVANTKVGDLNLSGYMAARYLNQLPPDQTATDHLGRPISVQARQDFQFHRVLLYASGWLLDPKFKYLTFVWTVNDTTQVAVGGTISYDFHKRFSLGIGLNALPGTRSMQGNHPYWPSYDRVMADEFFRPFFTQGVFGSGEIVKRLHYKWMVGNNLSTLGTKATAITRDLNWSISLTWMPTTGEFGPRGGFGDFENHEKLATRFGGSYSVSPEGRQSAVNDPTGNTTLRLADSLNVFDKGTFAQNVTVLNTTYRMAAADIGFKKRGFWIQGEGYYRRLNNFRADGPIPVTAVRDIGFYVQAAYMVVPKKVELYGATSYVFSNYGRPEEFIVGGNWYPANSRNYRLNLHLVNVDQSPVSSTFGFYMGKITG